MPSRIQLVPEAKESTLPETHPDIVAFTQAIDSVLRFVAKSTRTPFNPRTCMARISNICGSKCDACRENTRVARLLRSRSKVAPGDMAKTLATHYQTKGDALWPARPLDLLHVVRVRCLQLHESYIRLWECEEWRKRLLFEYKAVQTSQLRDLERVQALVEDARARADVALTESSTEEALEQTKAV